MERHCKKIVRNDIDALYKFLHKHTCIFDMCGWHVNSYSLYPVPALKFSSLASNIAEISIDYKYMIFF